MDNSQHTSQMPSMPTTGDLCSAAKQNNLQLVKELIEQGHDINSQEPANHETALHICSRLGHTDISMFLLSKTPDLKLTDINGWTCLHTAIHSESIEITMAIYGSKLSHSVINAGVQPKADTDNNTDTCDNNNDKPQEFPVGTTPLHMIVLMKSQSLLEKLLELYSLNVFITDSLERTPINIAEKLIDDGDDDESVFNSIAKKSKTALCDSISKGEVSLAIKLITHGANVNQVDSKGYSALYLAIEHKQPEIVQALIEHGCDVNFKVFHTDYKRRYQQGLTGLHLACVQKDADVVKMLTNAGANVNIPDAHNITPLQTVCKQQMSPNDKENLKLVLAVITDLLNHGADVNFALETSKDMKPLQLASGRFPNNDYTKPVCVVLLSSGADLSTCIKDETQQLRLEQTLLRKSETMISFFLDYGYQFKHLDANNESINAQFIRQESLKVQTLLKLARDKTRQMMQRGQCPNIWYGVNTLQLPANFDTSVITLYSNEIISMINN